MRNLWLVAALVSPLAVAGQQLKVEANTLLRLPVSGSVLQLERLEVADHGTLLLPAGLNELRVDELLLGREARIGIAPSGQAFRLDVAHGQIGARVHLSARGTPGTMRQPPSAGRTLNLRLVDVSLLDLTIDARGGAGVPGYRGLDGAAGEAAGCAWGASSSGHDGQAGTDGSTGGAGAVVRLEVPQDFPIELIKVRLDGGAGGLAGEGGKAGPGGAGKGCLVYSAEGGKAGSAGQSGRPGMAGPAGVLDVVRLPASATPAHGAEPGHAAAEQAGAALPAVDQD